MVCGKLPESDVARGGSRVGPGAQPPKFYSPPVFRRTLLRYVRLMACLSSVTLLRPTQRVEIFRSIFVPCYYWRLRQFVLKLWEKFQGVLGDRTS